MGWNPTLRGGAWGWRFRQARTPRLRGGRIAVRLVLTTPVECGPREAGAMDHLYYGDNLAVLRDSIADGSVDLIYLDPPVNSTNSSPTFVPWLVSGTNRQIESRIPSPGLL